MLHSLVFDDLTIGITIEKDNQFQWEAPVKTDSKSERAIFNFTQAVPQIELWLLEITRRKGGGKANNELVCASKISARKRAQWKKKEEDRCIVGHRREENKNDVSLDLDCNKEVEKRRNKRYTHTAQQNTYFRVSIHLIFVGWDKREVSHSKHGIKCFNFGLCN